MHATKWKYWVSFDFLWTGDRITASNSGGIWNGLGQFLRPRPKLGSAAFRSIVTADKSTAPWHTVPTATRHPSSVGRCTPGFPLYFGTEIQGLFKDFEGPLSCIFKEQFSTKFYSMDSITAIFNIYFCDYGTVLVDKNKTWRLLATLCFRQNTCFTKLMISHSLTLWIQGLPSTCPVFKYIQCLEFRRKKFKDF